MQEQMLNQKLKGYIARNIGTHIYIGDKINQIGGTNKFNVKLGVAMPRMIFDDEAKKQYIKFLKFNDIYDLDFELDREGNPKAVYNLDIIYENISKKEYRLKYAISNILLEEIYPNLMDVDLIKNNLRPIYVILTGIFNNKVLNKNFIKKYPRRERFELYLKFLLDYGIIRQDLEGNYVQGNIPIGLQEALKNKNEKEVLRYSFGYILKDGRKYLREELHLYMLDVFLTIITTYYYLCLKAGKIIKITKDTFLDNYIYSYQKEIHGSKFLSYLEDLISANVLFKKKNYYYGNKNILDKLFIKPNLSVFSEM